VHFSYDITMRNASWWRKCISLNWGGNVKLFIFTYTKTMKESNLNMQYFLWSDLHLFVLILWLALFISIGNLYTKIVFFLYCDLDTTPDLLESLLIVCKHCECSGSSGIVSKTNFWILILHIFIHLKSQGCRFLPVYLWCDSHWNVGNPWMR
jgi:hypothetical protein